MSQLNRYKLGPEYKVLVHASSKGSQEKYYKEGYWYKKNNVGNEALSEELISKILRCSNITNYVEYERCYINDKLGCRSKSFLEEGEEFVTFQRLYSNYVGGQLVDQIRSINDTKGRFEYLIDFVKKATGMDCSDYVRNNLSLDLLIRNPDRHFHNLGIIKTSDGNYREAPIFDNGQGLGMNFNITPADLSIEEKLEKLTASTISGSFEAQVLAAGNSLKIDYEKLSKILEDYEESFAKEFLLYQLKHHQNLFKEEISLLDQVLSGKYVLSYESKSTEKDLER